jgi:plasmid stability protein
MPVGTLLHMIRVACVVALLLPLAVTSAARAELTTGGVGAVPGWDWPLAGTPPVVRAFDPPAAPWLPGHRGVDLAGAPNDPVRAAAAGVVAFAGTVAGRGVVSVDHAGGLRTTYEPVTADVQISDVVRLGSPLGTLDAGHAGCNAAACLHWGLRRGATYLDPLLLLRPLRVRLKPVARSRSASIACTRREVDVATLMIRDLDEGVKARLRLRAAGNGRSMEAEARAILAAALIEPTTPRGLGSWIREQFLDVDEVPIEVPPRTDTARGADFGP